MKTILITGAAGFLGSHLCQKFMLEGYNVIGMDNLITGHLSNIEHLLPLEHFTYFHHDITNYIHIPGDLHYILHFASPASPTDYLKYPIQTLKVGALGTHNLLGVAKAKNARILVASTSEVYGDPLLHPQPEHYWGNVNPIGPRGVYDEAKRYQEALTMAYHKTHGIETRIARIFNTYGPNMRIDDGRAIPNFMMNALQNKPLEIFGDGLQTRSFCYVSDTVNAISKLLLNNVISEPVNIGNDKELTILDLAKNIIAITGAQSDIIFKDKRNDDPYRRRPDITRANTWLEWQPKVSLLDGLQSFAEQLKKTL